MWMIEVELSIERVIKEEWPSSGPTLSPYTNLSFLQCLILSTSFIFYFKPAFSLKPNKYPSGAYIYTHPHLIPLTHSGLAHCSNISCLLISQVLLSCVEVVREKESERERDRENGHCGRK